MSTEEEKAWKKLGKARQKVRRLRKSGEGYNGGLCDAEMWMFDMLENWIAAELDEEG